MVALRGAGIDKFVAQPSFSARAILIYGPDNGLVRERAKLLVTKAAGTLDDPFSISKLSDTDLVGDPARLVDEVQTISFTQTRRVIWVNPAEAAFASAIELVLATQASDCLIIAEAGDLRPSAKLRKIFEQTKDLLALPCYNDDMSSLSRLIDDEISSFDLTISDEAKTALLSQLGADRGLSRSELGKLCLYCLNKKTIEIEDIDRICGDAAAITLDKIIDAACNGEADIVEKLFNQAMISGITSNQILSSICRHFVSLHNMNCQMGHGGNVDNILKQARPPIHFKRKASVRRQLLAWQEADLRQALKFTLELEAKTRSQYMPLDTAIGRALLSLTTKAARLHQLR